MTDPLDVGHEPLLVKRIRAEIGRSGPITFARFMELALYEPDLGYYRRPEVRPGRGGDFLTAPETHPIFGHALARQLQEMWEQLGRPDPFVVREYGASTGALASAALDGLTRDRSSLAEVIRWQPIEIDERRIAAFHDRLTALGHRAVIAADGPEAIVGAVVANEFLDALPVHRVTTMNGRLTELHVEWADGAFRDVPAPPSTPALAERLAAEGVELAEGQRAEVALTIDDWVAEVADRLARGFVMVIDYGYPAAELYGPHRGAGTLMAYAGHRAHDDPYRAVGRQDLTAHVDLTALERAAAAHGLTVLGVTSQAEFIAGVGGDDLLERARGDATTYADYLTLRSAVGRMLDPRAMGRFTVLVLGKGTAVDVRLSGLAYRLAPRP